MLIDRLFFTLLLVFLPTQLTKHFFPDFSLVLGSRIDYYAFKISLTDILLLATIIFWFIRKRKEICLKIKKTAKKIKKSYLFLAFFFIFLNLLVSLSKELALLKLVKLVEFVLLGFYILYENISFKWTVKYLLIGALYSAFIATGQFIRQSSLGGLWWLFGERNFSLQTPGISKAIIFGKLILRPYATFPHPNVLAGFLSSLLPFLAFYLTYSKTKRGKLFSLLFLIVLTATLLLTFSRTAILVGLFGLFATLILLKKQNKFSTKQITILLLALTVLLLIFSQLIVGRFYSLLTGTEETLNQRNELVKASVQMFLLNPVTGIGFNNFIKTLPSISAVPPALILLQPVHNTYLLVLSETGLVGLALFILLLYKARKNIFGKTSFLKPLFTIVFYQMLILLFFDHYFYTLQQGQLLFTLLISFMIKKDLDYA